MSILAGGFAGVFTLLALLSFPGRESAVYVVAAAIAWAIAYNIGG